MNTRTTHGATVLIDAPNWLEVDGAHRRLLETSGLRALIPPSQILPADLPRLIADFQPNIVVAGDCYWSPDAIGLAKSNGLVVLSRHGSGINPDMRRGCELHGVGLANTPGTTITPVSELTVGLILAGLRRIAVSNAEMSQPANDWKRVPGQELRGKNIVVLGSGNIGKAVGRLLVPFGAHVTMMSRNQDDGTKSLVAGYRALNEGVMLPNIGAHYGTFAWRSASERTAALADADIVVLLIPLSDETTGLVDTAFLAAMKRGAMLVSISRGALIKSEAEVVEAVRSGQLGFAAVDVFTKEPARTPDDSAFLGLDDETGSRFLRLPHVGWLTVQNVERQLHAALKNGIAGFTGHPEAAMNWVVPIPA